MRFETEISLTLPCTFPHPPTNNNKSKSILSPNKLQNYFTDLTHHIHTTADSSSSTFYFYFNLSFLSFFLVCSFCRQKRENQISP